jgi:hypothetical protein
MTTKTVRHPKVTYCRRCSSPIVVRNPMLAVAVKRMGRPLCPACRDEVAGDGVRR